MKLFNKVGPTARKIGFGLKKHSPEILIVGGIVGVVVSTVMACVATTKTKDILDTTKKDVKLIHDRKDDPQIEYSEHDMKKDLTATYFKTAGRFVKLYAPSVILGALSLTSVITSNAILRKRVVALSAAYAAVDKGFKDYRNRVIERFGEETDKDLRFGIQSKTIKETVVDPKTGKEKTVEKEIKVSNYNGVSEYARVYDRASVGEMYTNDHDYNLCFLKREQSWANDRLQLQGYLYLNDIYDRLGFEKTKAGQIVGWRYDPSNPKIDSYIDFGITDVYNTNNVNNADGFERVILLDFNVDGPIIDLVHKDKI